MIFGFPEVSHRKFNKNFLKVVVFQIQFDKLNDFKNKRKEIIEFFKELFPRVGTPQSGIEISFSNSQTPIVQHIKDDENIEMKSLNGQKTLNISDSSLTLNITGREYISYDFLKLEINYIVELLNKLSILELVRIAIRKINVVDFKYPQGNPSPILRSLVNANLIGNLDYYPDIDSMKQNIHTLVYKKDNYNFNIKYGLNVLPVPETAQLLMDFDMFNIGKTPTTQIFTIADNINQEIFNSFNWIATENLLTLLDA